MSKKIKRQRSRTKKSNTNKQVIFLSCFVLILVSVLLIGKNFTRNSIKLIGQYSPKSASATESGQMNLILGIPLVDTGAEQVISWSGIVNPTVSDWIGLYSPTDPDTLPLARYYTSIIKRGNPCPDKSGAKASSIGGCRFPIPISTPIGTYEFRLFSNNTYSLIGKSGTFPIVNVNLTASPDTTSIGQTLNVSWQNQARSSYKNWIGFFAKGASDSQRSAIMWSYVNCTKTPTMDIRSGTCSYTVPSKTAKGIYEFRFFDDAYGKTDISNPVTIQ